MYRDPQIELAMAARFKATAAALVIAAKSICPVDTGYLRATIETLRADSSGCDVGTECHYAAYVEFGTEKTAAQPFLRPALDIAGPAIEAIWS